MLAAAVIGYALAPRDRASRHGLALGAAGAALAFIGLTFLYVEFMNACNVGEAFLLDPPC